MKAQKQTKQKYIHYGSDRFSSTRWNPISDSDYHWKPTGGLWASPMDAEWGWKDWCERENFRSYDPADCFAFTLRDTARVLEITPDNVWDLPVKKKVGIPTDPDEIMYVLGTNRNIGFEELAKNYDVLVCNITKYPALYWRLYGWDCDCILVMNPDVIICEEVSE